MKQFLYLDMEIINSIIAQTEQGLVTQKSAESDQSTQKSEEDKTHSEVQLGLSAGVSKLLKFVGNMNHSQEELLRTSDSSSSKDVVTKVIHDAAFDIARSYINPYNPELNDQSYDDVGNYLQLYRVFEFIDFEYLDKLFCDNGIIDLAKKSVAKQIHESAEKATEGLGREQLRKANAKFNAELKRTVSLSNQQYDDAATALKALRSVLPYRRMMLSSDGYLIPLDDRHFRIAPDSMGFRYGGEITCFGMVTNIIGADTDPCDNKNIFATLQFQVNELLRNLLPTQSENLCVLHPIAIYYGN
ncbi:hypothetical protein [Acutalibacter muris]|jgi:hypothetical protein|uniref:DUF6414 family protein n=2 Tax=Acutalibacter muris TaxID=1796620 RepID=UPI00191786BB|nr:hypothetical protein [Acutalibacter muris]